MCNEENNTSDDMEEGSICISGRKLLNLFDVEGNCKKQENLAIASFTSFEAFYTATSVLSNEEIRF